MTVKYIEVFEAGALEALIDTGMQVLAGSPFAVRAGPHQIACFGRDDQLVAVSLQLFLEYFTEIAFCRSGRGAVVVGNIDVGDSMVEGVKDHLFCLFLVVYVAKIMPQAQ